MIRRNTTLSLLQYLFICISDVFDRAEQYDPPAQSKLLNFLIFSLHCVESNVLNDIST